MTLSTFLTLLTASVVISLTPGAGAINTMTNSLTVGWRRSFWGVVGQQLAIIAYVGLVAAGVGLIVSRSQLLFDSIRYVGAAYLVFLGLRLMLVKTDATVEHEDAPAPALFQESAWAIVRRGFWVNILNPKAMVFFLAFMPQFITLNQPQLPQYLIFTVTVVVVDIVVMWFGFALAARPFRRLTATPRGRKIINIVFGVLFIAVAALLVGMH